MSRFTFYKGLADSLVGVILLAKPELIYDSAVARWLHGISGLRLPNPYPDSLDTVSAQHAVAIMVIAVGVGHMRAASERKALPPIVLMNVLWSAFALGTVVLKPHRATSALLMTGINHAVFASTMLLTSGMSFVEMLGLQSGERAKME
ncbi:hypothetical protein BU26DRAFT_521978 [Trematosphaeria pertusa]|uniref:Uncharacterized protein n=1 Tax=Trematosphaeria pertusa TaxID=390896 RepID=A0A6A6I7P3_9PLEO|nr:uncharacterized protein BU26DRAFT_521978 [Trematosphaeria pertusa]KAF2245553.1 hypothetical protein BU26DRAFT_521978 [Trematosphaeria pertusa]